MLTEIKQDFANPEVVKYMEFYPEETDGSISEAWQAERWKEFSPLDRTPMYASGMRHFYINEVAELADGRLVIPLAWIKRAGRIFGHSRMIIAAPVSTLSAFNHVVLLTSVETGWQFFDDEIYKIPGDLFVHTFLDLSSRFHGTIPWAGEP